MNVKEMEVLLAEGKVDSVESAWSRALADREAVEQLVAVLKLMTAAGQGERADMMVWAGLSERPEAEPAETLELARALAAAVSAGSELRSLVAGLYRTTRGSADHFDDLLKLSGLLGTQSARRAMRTLDVCLELKPGGYVVNRFDGKVLRVRAFEATMGEYELVEPSGSTVQMDPRSLADEHDPAGESDFRVLCQHRKEELGRLLDGDPTQVLVGVCLGHGGQVDADELKDLLVPAYLESSQWSSWWSKARTAVKRCPNLTLSGRNPVTISFHAGGMTLEQELASAVEAARTPLGKLAVLQQYARELKSRKSQPNEAFARSLLAALTEQAAAFRQGRPADALAANLAVVEAASLGLASADTAAQAQAKATEIIQTYPRAADAVAALADSSLWTPGLDLLMGRSDAAAQLEQLIRLSPSGCLDDVAGRLEGLGRTDAVERAATEALADIPNRTELFAWLWKGPARPPANLPGKVELLAKMLKTMLDIEHDWHVSPSVRKNVHRRLRSALAAGEYGVYRQSVQEMDEGVAGTIKRLIERGGGLTHTNQDVLQEALKEKFYALFARKRVAAWEDATCIYTTEAALDRYEADLKDLMEIKIPANAKAIGAAAAHGDLSENSEWKFALEERDLLQARAKRMQEDLSRARVIHADDVPADSVAIGSKVTLRRLADNAAVEMTFLGPWDSDVSRNIFSYQTAIALELMGKPVGTTVTLKIDGQEGEYNIEAVASGIKE